VLTSFRRHLTYSNVVSTLCLFVLLGGGAYAATKLPKNSVGAKQIKANAVTSDKVKDGNLLATDFKAGQLPQGEPGVPGKDATNLFASIDDHGPTSGSDVAYGHGVTSVAENNPSANDGSYTVTFNRSLENCVVQVTTGLGSPTTGSTAVTQGLSPQINGNDFPAGQAVVNLRDFNANFQDSSFFISAFC
jgi:hypothetical protein